MHSLNAVYEIFSPRQVLFTMEQEPNTVLSAEIENLLI